MRNGLDQFALVMAAEKKASAPVFQLTVADRVERRNLVLTALVGLCPLLAVTTTAVNGIVLGLATLGVLVLSCVTVSLLRNHTRQELLLPIYTLVIATHVTVVEIAMKAYFYPIYEVLGLYVPLIATNCAIISRAEVFASRSKPVPAAIDAVVVGMGFLWVLVVLGGLRELIGTGALLDGMHLIVGPVARLWKLYVFPVDQGLVLAMLPPGAFIGLGLLIAARNSFVALRGERAPEVRHPEDLPGGFGR